MATLIIYIFVCIVSDVMGGLAPTNLLPIRIGPCSTNPSVEVTVSEMSFNTKMYQTSLGGTFNITNDVDNGWVIMGTMQKCQDIRNLDTCDYFKSFAVISNGCAEDDDDPEGDELYSMFFHHVHPRLSCPIKAGNYKIINYPLFTEDNYLIVAESKISTSVFGYTLRLEAYIESIRILCVEASLQLLYIREYKGREDPTDDLGTGATVEPNDEEERAASEEGGEASEE